MDECGVCGASEVTGSCRVCGADLCTDCTCCERKDTGLRYGRVSKGRWGSDHGGAGVRIHRGDDIDGED